MSPGGEVKKFIALGDSFTEGLWDERSDGTLRGWADRLADGLARAYAPEPVHYANLAVRGKLARQVLAEQVPIAEKFLERGDIVTFHAGANDVLRPNVNFEDVERDYRESVRRLSATGATVLLFSAAGRIGAKGRVREGLGERLNRFNEVITRAAEEFGARVIPTAYEPALHDYRFWDSDRLHLTPEGHRRVAHAALSTLGLPHDLNWRAPLPPTKPKPRPLVVLLEIRWWITFVIPWIYRRVRGISSGDGRPAKYPVPLEWVPEP